MLNIHLCAASQIVLGTYSSQNSANKIKLQVDTLIQKDSKFKKFLLKNSIRSVVKQKDNFFIVTLEPINDIVTQHAIINRVKRSDFKDAYALNMIPSTNINKDILLQKEPKLQDIKIETTKQNSPSFNLLERYFNELIAAIVILIVSIIYLSIKKKQHSTNQFTEYVPKKRTKDKAKKDLTQQVDEPQKEEEIYKLKSEGAISFDLLDDTAQEESFPHSNITKREIEHHYNTTKADFREFNGSRIMIAEDNIINQKVIQGVLSDSGIELVMVNDGQEVLDFLEKDSNFCIILMDAHMPKMDGYEATQAIRANPKYDHITVVALSGDTALDDIKNMKKVGMQEHLEKPLKMDPLYDLLNAYTYKKQEITLAKELDLKRGLEICGGESNFYKEILEDFLNNYSDSNKEIEKFLHAKQYQSAQNLLLDIGSLSSNIGAKNIGLLANKLRTSLDTPEESQYLDLFKTYAKHFDALKYEGKNYLKL